MSNDDDQSFNEFLDDMEDDPDFQKYREQRIRELKQEIKSQQNMISHQHGLYTELSSEKDFLTLTTKASKKVICHFFHKEFTRCKIMDVHLETLARKYFETKFVKIDVEKAPFFVEKLQVKVLPCVIVLIDGIVVDRIVGFDELGGTDNFKTHTLEMRLHKTGVLGVGVGANFDSEHDGTIFGFAKSAKGYESDD